MNTDRKTILLMCDSLERYRFMRRLYHALSDFDVYYITSEPLIKGLSYLYSENCIFIRYTKKKYDTSISNKLNPALSYEIKKIGAKSIEVLNKQVDINKAIIDISNVINKLETNFRENLPHKIVIWNGQQILGRALSLYCRTYDIKTRFLEISNFHNKLFCDDKGVNACSQLAENPAILDKYPEINQRFHEEWLTNYIESKEKPLPQSIKAMSHLLLGLINNLLKLLIPCIGTGSIILKKLKNPKNKLNYSKVIQKNLNYCEKYLFLPLQVSNDTQVMLHSRVDNVEAIKKANQFAFKNNLKLIVKFHPAEISQIEVDRVIKLQDKLAFYIDNSNTIKLINSAQCVATINSTVGLEAKILGKNVYVYGNALYKDFDSERVKKYIHCYLVDGADYFEKKVISKRTAMEIINE